MTISFYLLVQEYVCFSTKYHRESIFAGMSISLFHQREKNVTISLEVNFDFWAKGADLLIRTPIIASQKEITAAILFISFNTAVPYIDFSTPSRSA